MSFSIINYGKFGSFVILQKGISKYNNIMKKALSIILLIALSLCGYAQKVYQVDLSAKVLKDYKSFKAGTYIEFSQVIYNKVMEVYEGNVSYRREYHIRAGDELIPIANKFKNYFSFEYNTLQNIWDAEIINNLYPVQKKKGFQKELRFEIEQDAIEYMNRLRAEGVLYNDPYLENYIYGLIAQIVPERFIDGREIDINLMILNDNALNMGIFPNGLLMISTGFLSCLHSEAELVAVLSHEIAHLVLDHHVQNVNKEISRKNRAEFWSALLTGATAVIEGVAAANSNYVPGVATMGMALLSASVASQVIDRLGMKYNLEQEREADRLAKYVLDMLQYDTNALATALFRLQEVEENHGYDKIYFASYSHRELIKRINAVGEVSPLRDVDFEKKLSFVITNVARNKYKEGHFKETIALVEQNIDNYVAVSEDLMLKANCLLSLYNNERSNNEALALIHLAKDLAPSDINIYKAEILAYLRLNDRDTAFRLLQEYDSILANASCWSVNLLCSEMEWSRDMKIKLEGGM